MGRGSSRLVLSLQRLSKAALLLSILSKSLIRRRREFRNQIFAPRMHADFQRYFSARRRIFISNWIRLLTRKTREASDSIRLSIIDRNSLLCECESTESSECDANNKSQSRIVTFREICSQNLKESPYGDGRDVGEEKAEDEQLITSCGTPYAIFEREIFSVILPVTSPEGLLQPSPPLVWFHLLSSFRR